MSINSIDHDEITDMKEKYDEKIDALQDKSEEQRKAAARRRIEVMREIKECGLTLEEARDLGLF